MEDKYTFGPDEKEILEILATFEQELQERLEESKTEIERVKYYEKFQLQGIDFKNLFITTQKDIDGNISYHIYSGDSSNEIISIDSEGNITMIPELEDYLGEFNLEDIMEENEKEEGRLKGVSEKIEPEEMQETLKENKPKAEQQNKEIKDEEEIEKEEIEEDLKEQGNDLEISSYRKIKDPYVAERIPEAFKQGQENGIAYSNKLNRFVIISKVGGQYQVNENIESSKVTWKSVISIDEDGEKIEKKVPHSLMRIQNNDEKEIAVTIGQYGEVEIETVDVLPCNERIARSVRMQGQGQEKEESKDIRDEFKTEGKEYKHELAHKTNKILKEQSENSGRDDMDITEEDYIPNTQMTWGELMEETGENLPTLIERYNKEMAKPDVDSQKAVEIIEQDYGNISHDRNRI